MALEINITKQCPTYAMFEGQRVDLGPQPLTRRFVVTVEEMTGTSAGGTAVVSFTADDLAYRKSYQLPFGIHTDMSAGSNIATPVYLFLKSLPEFAGARDA